MLFAFFAFSFALFAIQTAPQHQFLDGGAYPTSLEASTRCTTTFMVPSLRDTMPVTSTTGKRNVFVQLGQIIRDVAEPPG